MIIEKLNAAPGGETGHGVDTICGVVRWTADGTVADLSKEIKKRGFQTLAFVDREFFAEHETAIAMCREMRELGINVLWIANMVVTPTRELLREMRLAGCQRLALALDAEAETKDVVKMAREFGFDISITSLDGTPILSGRTQYSVAERETIAQQMSGLHSVQFDLAVSYFKARRFGEVMLPLSKAMTLRFPVNELCLNLLACLSAAKHYPDMAANLLQLAEHGRSQPVVRQNQSLIDDWRANRGDVRGVRLELEPEICRSR